ncbi:UNVERIFIED_CONTAM: hypothetical protein NY603_21165, partial [Bacteroidetes bacterium 56_B9]
MMADGAETVLRLFWLAHQRLLSGEIEMIDVPKGWYSTGEDCAVVDDFVRPARLGLGCAEQHAKGGWDVRCSP